MEAVRGVFVVRRRRGDDEVAAEGAEGEGGREGPAGVGAEGFDGLGEGLVSEEEERRSFKETRWS